MIESWRPADDVSHDRRRGLEQALETLPEDQRGVVVLRHLVGLSPGEIADRMGRTESSIHGLHHRARLALRRELEGVECAPTTRAPVARNGRVGSASPSANGCGTCRRSLPREEAVGAGFALPLAGRGLS